MARPNKSAKAKAPLKAGEKRAVTAVEPTVDREARPTFSFRLADIGSTGAFHWPPRGDDAHEVLRFLGDASRSTWHELRGQLTSNKRASHRRHHAQPFNTVCPDARGRVAALHLEEQFEELFRFRLSGAGRLWGCVSDNTFFVLWWDPDHAVYPLEAD